MAIYARAFSSKERLGGMFVGCRSALGLGGCELHYL
jgi:hypothetical protein